MIQQITLTHAWCFTVTSILSVTGWSFWAALAGQLPFHPWLSIPIAVAVFVAMYAWTSTSMATAIRLNRAIGYWNLCVVAGVISAFCFSRPGQPFPEFAINIIPGGGGLLVLTATWCGLLNMLRHLIGRRSASGFGWT